MPGEAARLTWVVEDALPDNEGEALQAKAPAFGSLEEMRRWCAANSDCVGFALLRRTEDPKAWGFHPKRRRSGFEAGEATWVPRKHGSGERWEFHYIRERAGPEDKDVLPEFLRGAAAQPWRLSKRIVAYGRGRAEDTPEVGDVVVYRVLEIVLDGHKVPGVTGESCQVALGSGDVCEALEFGLLKMKAGERSRISAPWALLKAVPPRPAAAAEALLDGRATAAELLLELLSFERGAPAALLAALDGHAGDDGEAGTGGDEDCKQLRMQQVRSLIDLAKEAKESGTRLFKAQRLALALARYISVCELLLCIDVNSQIDLDPMTRLMGVTESHIQQGQQTLRGVLGAELTAEASAVLLAARLNTALCWLNLREWARAAAACDEALRTDGDSVKAHYRKAQASMGLGQLDAARASLKEVLRLDPENPEAKKLLHEATAKAKDEKASDHERLKRAAQLAGGGLGSASGRRSAAGKEQPPPDSAGGFLGAGWGGGPGGCAGMQPGMSPIDVARQAGNQEVVDVMEDHLERRRVEAIMEEYGVSREEAEAVRARGGL